MSKLKIYAGAGGEDALSCAFAVAMIFQDAGMVYDGELERVITMHDDSERILRAKIDSGVYRVIRISPYDPLHRRHTSFCRVEVDGHFDDKIHTTYCYAPYQQITYHRTGEALKW